MEFILPKGHRGGHHANVTTRKTLRRQLQRRLDADDNILRIRYPQIFNGSSGGCVAGNHQCLDATLTEHRRCVQGQLPHLIGGALAVGSIGRVAEIQVIFLGHQLYQLPQDTDTAHTGIKHRNIIIFPGHTLTPSLVFYHSTKKSPNFQLPEKQKPRQCLPGF